MRRWVYARLFFELVELCAISAIAMFAISPHRVHYNQLLLIGAKSICLYSWKKIFIMKIDLHHAMLTRSLGLWGAATMGLGAMLGTGVFVTIGMAAGVAGPSVLLAIALAAAVAACNALSSAQLAAAHPVSGGTYEYGYRYLHPTFGFAAGWMFLCAKSASAATAALGFSGYVLHAAGWSLPKTSLAIPLIVVITFLVLAGIKKSNAANIVIVSFTLFTLLLFVLLALPRSWRETQDSLMPLLPQHKDGWMAFFSATALMFVAYTGYGRIATMGEEVKEPRRTIPRAIIAVMIISALLYMAVGMAAIGSVGAGELGRMTLQHAAPLEAILQTRNLPVIAWIVALGAIVAMVGVLLNLILGLSRVALAMGRRGDLPASFSLLNTTRTTPTTATIAVGMVVTLLALIGDIKLTWSFSAFTVLVYYAITNLAALRTKPGGGGNRTPVRVCFTNASTCLFRL